MKLKLLLCLLLVPLVVISCRGNSNIDRYREACDFFTKDDAEQILGERLNEAVKSKTERLSNQGYVTNCSYTPIEIKRIPSSASLMIRYAHTSEDDPDPYATYTASLKRTLGEAFIMEEVPGIGDKAGWMPASKQLSIFKGRDLYIIQANDLFKAKIIADLVMKKITA